ncbi:MAG: hypothetical protein J6S21_07415 [Victivallales bacterium]|jgi:hypothetical protein|nr:hypothetical protein [Victivallales bacterium]
MSEKVIEDGIAVKPVPEISTIERVICALNREGIRESAETIARITGVREEDALLNLVRGEVESGR